MSLTFCKQILMISKLIRRKELGGEKDQPPPLRPKIFFIF